MKDLGYANGWHGGVPEEYKKHEALCKDYGDAGAEHRKQVVYTKLGNCLHGYQCLLCNISWKVDSSD